MPTLPKPRLFIVSELLDAGGFRFALRGRSFFALALPDQLAHPSVMREWLSSIIPATIDIFLMPFRVLLRRTPHFRELACAWRIFRLYRARGELLDLFRFHEYAYTLARLSRTRPAALIDIGSGNGLFPLALARFAQPADLLLVDTDASQLAVQKERFASETGRVDFGMTDYSTGVPSGSAARFDCATLISTVEHIEGSGDLDLLSNLWHVLRPGASVHITVPALDYYEEKHAKHYHGAFERRYDQRSLYARLVPNGYALDDFQVICHARGFLARRLAKRHGNLNDFFRAMYCEKSPSPLAHLFYALVLLSRSSQWQPNTIGALLTLRKTARQAADPIAMLKGPMSLDLSAVAATDERFMVLSLPLESATILNPFTDNSIVLPFTLVNNTPHSVNPNDVSPHAPFGGHHIGVHVYSETGELLEWDHAHLKFPMMVAPRSVKLFALDVPLPAEVRDGMMLVFDIVKDNEYWQESKGGAVARVRLRK